MAIIWLKFKGYIIGIASVIASVVAIYWAGRRQGYNSAENDAREADHEQARKIEDIADRVRNADGNNVTAIERLRVARKLRDL